MSQWLTSAFGGWLTSPWLFLGGALLVAAPIIIHLLNKRRFKIVDWAAMTFLLDANVRNRRRIRLENLILLALRCLAVLLAALLVARPFVPTGLTGGLIEAARYERIVVLDDSLSMQARVGNQTAFDEARAGVIKLLEDLAADSSDDSLTLLLTSRPKQPAAAGARVDSDTLPELTGMLRDLEPADRTAHFDVALQEVERHVQSQSRAMNRVVYIYTDLRRRDWSPDLEAKRSTGQRLADAPAQARNHPAKILARIAETASGCVVVDVSGASQNNLLVTSVRPEETLVAGVRSPFEVTVANLGATDAQNVSVKFTAGESLPLVEEIDLLPAGKSATLTFNYTFAPVEASADGQAPTVESVPVTVEVSSASGLDLDRLPADSTRFFPARVVPGIPVLLVNGDPSTAYGQDETLYLERALAPPGQAASGAVYTVVTETELESTPLDKHRLIVLCNVYQLSEEPTASRRIADLERWVRDGGNLVFMLGDHVDEYFFNKYFYRDGRGLSPVKLQGLRGDEEEQSWVGFRVEAQNHELLRQFAGQNNPLLDDVKVFRWWGASVAPGANTSVLMRMTDDERSPAVVEKGYGKGRVIAFLTPADADWSDWPDKPSYVVLVQELTRYLAGDSTGEGAVRVGDPMRYLIDRALYEQEATITAPGNRKINVQAFPVAVKNAKKPASANGESSAESESPPEATTEQNERQSAAATLWRIDFEGADRRGFYDLRLTPTSGAPAESVLFAANVDPSEGDLSRVDVDALRKEWRGLPVTILENHETASQSVHGARIEIWMFLLAGLVGVLFTEQFLGWWFGRKR